MGRQFTISQKRAAIDALKSLTATNQFTSPTVEAVAKAHGVSARTLYRWLKDPRLTVPSATTNETKRDSLTITADMLAVLAHEQTIHGAWQKLKKAGFLSCSYPTFCRAVKRAHPALVQGAISGRKGLTNNRLYFANQAPHAAHTLHIDHSELDLWVLPDHRSLTPVRPWVTVVVDASTSLLWAVPWYQTPKSEMVSAALALACIPSKIDGTEVGGIPEQVVLDNAAEHFAKTMVETTHRLGVILAPTNARSSWQNGKAERAIRLLNQRLSNRAPGAIRAGEELTSTRYLASQRDRTDPANLLTAKAFEVLMRETVHEINTTIPVDHLGGRTRLAAYGDDRTERRVLSDDILRTVAISTFRDTYTASKNGISFQTRRYIAAGIHPGKKYKVRYLPTRPDFIEVFEPSGEHVARAYLADSVPEQEFNRIMAERARQERTFKEVEAGVQQHRRHIAALRNEEAALSGTDDPLADVTGRNPALARRKGDGRLPRVSEPPKTASVEDRALDGLLQEHASPSILSNFDPDE